jgi:hypothetical protein
MTRPCRAPAVLLCLVVASCFDHPVREDLLLRFLPNGTVVATSTVRITADQDVENPALAQRLAETRRAILDGSDAWGARFALTDPAAERFWWEKEQGELRAASRSAVIADAERLEALFADTSVGLTYTIDGGQAELTLVPGPATRATRRQREELKKTLDTWSAAIAEYLEAGADLYAHLEREPDRARTCFGLLFADLVDERMLESLDQPTEEETASIERLEEAMREVVDVLLVPPRAEHSADEISRLVYDPFPARLTVKLPGPPVEVEGFQVGEDGELAVSGLGLWEALRSLEGRWLAPDPVLFYVDSFRQLKRAAIDLDAFVQEPREVAPAHDLPSPQEVRAAIEEQLRPAPVYRVSWEVQPEDETEFRWDEPEHAP